MRSRFPSLWIVAGLLTWGGCPGHPGGDPPPTALQGLQAGITFLPGETYATELLRHLRRAEEEITVAMFLVKVHPGRGGRVLEILDSLIEAAARGVRVQVLLERDRGGRGSVERVNAAAAARLKAGGVSVVWDSRDVTTHAKLVIVDRRWTFLGSHNLTESALRHNAEASVVVDSPAFAQRALRFLRQGPASP